MVKTNKIKCLILWPRKDEIFQMVPPLNLKTFWEEKNNIIPIPLFCEWEENTSEEGRRVHDVYWDIPLKKCELFFKLMLAQVLESRMMLLKVELFQ